jgi:hypothetical protein
LIIEPSNTNIVCFSLAWPGSGLKRSNLGTNQLIEWLEQSPSFAASRTKLSLEKYGELIPAFVDATSFRMIKDNKRF